MKHLKPILISLVLCFLVFSFPSQAAPTKAELIASLKSQIAIILQQIQILQEQLNILRQGSESSGLQTIPSGFTFQPTFKIGSTSDSTKYLQYIFNTDISTNFQGTGYFGPKTQQAVIQFKQKYGTGQANAVIGNKTVAKLNELLAQFRNDPSTGSGPSPLPPSGATACGDGIIQTPNSQGTTEVCDKTNLNNQTCQTRGYASGSLTCSSDCLTFNTTQCQRPSGTVGPSSAPGGASAGEGGSSTPTQNRAPVLNNIGSKTTQQGNAFSFALSATDPDKDNLTYTASALPAGASFNSATKVFSWNPQTAGTYQITFTVSDGKTTDTETITVTVSSAPVANTPPTAQNQSVNLDEDTNTAITLSATDENSDNLTYTVLTNPSHGTLAGQAPNLTYTPTANYFGTDSFTFRANDGQANSNTATVSITINSVNDAPILNAIGNKTVNENQALSFTVSATDIDDTSLTYSTQNRPTGSTFSSTTRTFSWTPTSSQSGTYTLTFIVSDGEATDQETITITVINVNRPPALNSIGNKSVIVNNALSFTVSATDPDNDPLTYSATNLPSGATFNTSTRTFSWTPSATGTYSNITFTVSDGSLTASETITISVITSEEVSKKQEIVNTITQAAHAYWAQRVVIDHPREGMLYGYSGAQTLVNGSDPNDRYYKSDTGYIPEPHIFQEFEDSPGHPSVGFAFIRAYQATGDKFLMRAAKELGDTLLSAQKDLGVGGWWQDMGTVGYDRRKGSPTFYQVVDFDKWMNLQPWGGHGNVLLNDQGLASFDGCSWSAGYFLLRLYQALPEDDPDRDKYLQGAKWLADEITGFKDVTDAEEGFHPYGSGGVPQIWPYDVMKDRPGYESDPTIYPYELPHNVMVTLNDDAMPSALAFLIEFWKEARTNPSLNESEYLQAIRLNVDYLMDVFDATANAKGRSAWASFYWINDDSERANKPTWGRPYEPPGISFVEYGDEPLLVWHQYETDPARKTRIENTLRNFLLYFKYDAPPVNSQPEWRDMIRLYIRAGIAIDNYDPDKIATWYWWRWYNHDDSVAPREVFVASEDVYHAYYGNDALIQEHNPDSHYPMALNHWQKIYHTLTGGDQLYLFDEANPNHNTHLNNYYRLIPDVRFFRGGKETSKGVDSALNLFDEETGFFMGGDSLKSLTKDGKVYYYVEDYLFQNQMRQLAWGVENTDGGLIDSDGDGYSDKEEIAAGTDPYDSESYPYQGKPSPQQCLATSTSCGIYPSCVNCNTLDGCYGTTYRDYYCASNSTGCSYTSSSNDPRCVTTECTAGQTQSCSTGLQGVCSSGTKTCQANGTWGSCVQTTQSSTEICNDSLDNDCDGTTDCNDSNCSSDPACQVSHTIPSDYISYWKFENNANDEKGTSNGTLVGDTYFVSDPQKGNAASFDGTGDYVSISHVPITSALTYLFWIKPMATTSDMNIISNLSTLVRGSNAILKYYPDIFKSVIQIANVFTIGNWHHIVITHNSDNNYYIYSNGKQIGSGSAAINIAEVSSKIGGYGTTYNLNGSVDDVMIYDRALSQAEITAIYNAQKPAGMAVNSNQTEEQKLTGLASLLNAIQEAVNKLKSLF